MEKSLLIHPSTLVSPLPDISHEPRYRVRVRLSEEVENQLIRIELEKPESFHFTAGQYLWLVLPERNARLGIVDRHAYSISSSPSSNFLELIIRKTKSEYLQDVSRLKTGDMVDIIGPMGSEFRASQEGAIFIAGGTGITPFLSMLRSDMPGDFALAFFMDKICPMHCKKEIIGISQAKKNVSVDITIGMPTVSAITPIFQKSHQSDHRPILVSGPLGFVNEVERILQSIGVSPSRIRYEACYPTDNLDEEMWGIFRRVDDSGHIMRELDQEKILSEHHKAQHERGEHWKHVDFLLNIGLLSLMIILSSVVFFIELWVRDEYLLVSFIFVLVFCLLTVVYFLTGRDRIVKQGVVVATFAALFFVRLDLDLVGYSGAWLAIFPIIATVFLTPRASFIWSMCFLILLGMTSIFAGLGVALFGWIPPRLNDAEQYLFAGVLVLIITQIFSRRQALYENDLQQEMVDQHELLNSKDRTYRLNEILAQISEQTSNHVIFTDRNGRILYANRAAERLTGYSFHEMRGQTPRLWGGLMPPPEYRELWRRKERGNVVTHEILNRRRNGELYTALGHITPLMREGRVFAYVATEEDITGLKQVDKAKTEFVSLASHQLRTPLSAINWYAEMLLAGDAGAVNNEQKKYLDEIYRGNQRMVELVNALLDVSRIELGTFSIEPEPTDIAELARSVIQEQKQQIQARKQEFSEKIASDIPVVPEDPKLLRMVFQNILSNAVKYTPEGGKIVFDLSVNPKKKEILFHISDSGMGIPKHQKEQIFAKLFRADNVKASDTDGTGLGLYIVKSIIDHADGKIWFESEEGKGTTFFVSLPMSGMKERVGTKKLSS